MNFKITRSNYHCYFGYRQGQGIYYVCMYVQKSRKLATIENTLTIIYYIHFQMLKICIKLNTTFTVTLHNISLKCFRVIFTYKTICIFINLILHNLKFLDQPLSKDIVIKIGLLKRFKLKQQLFASGIPLKQYMFQSYFNKC